MCTPVTSQHMALMAIPSLAMTHQHWPKKGGFCTQNRHFSGWIYPFKMSLVIGNDLPNSSFIFPLLFKYLIVFTATFWQRTKLEPSKQESQNLISAIFDKPGPLKRVIKIKFWQNMTIGFTHTWSTLLVIENLAAGKEGQKRA